ncbi:MAG: hypothetical protein C0596_09865 [Marinilabiliales bacterium]|nr:MAG: hypothetical protein C0596_09865 [Marinilabiliales bacterium]
MHYSNSRASKDAYNRQRGLKRLEKMIKSGKLSKSSINNRGYNKYLKLTGEVAIEIDYQKFNNDDAWDGLKGYITNTKLNNQQVLDNYKNLWHIEKAFRMSKNRFTNTSNIPQIAKSYRSSYLHIIYCILHLQGIREGTVSSKIETLAQDSC